MAFLTCALFSKRQSIKKDETLEEVYFKAIVPSVTYGILVWGNCQP